MRRLQDEVRSALTKYALLPVAVIAVLALSLALFYWNRNVVARNAQSRELVAGILTETVTDYEEHSEEIARLGLRGLQGSPAEQQAFYEKFYAQTKIHEEHPEFYLLDAERSLLLTNQPGLPEYFQGTGPGWGVLYRMSLSEGNVVEFAQDHQTGRWDLLVGRAIRQNGRLQGYIVFALPENLLAQSISLPEVHFLLRDAYGYAPLSTLGIFHDVKFQKAVPELQTADGLISLENQRFYVTSQPVLDGAFTIYAFSPVDSYLTQYVTGAAVLGGMFLLMVPLILFSVRRETRDKMQAMEELAAAFAAVKRGQLDYRLDIHTGNEFESIADEYNHMVQSLQELLVQNEAEARVNVVSELRQLEAQFNPHFLFNTLENIKFMIRLEPAAAERMLMALSTLLRYSINNTIRQVRLEEDLSYLKSYLDIQQQRFGARLIYTEKKAPEAMDCIVPKLLLQPVVENAIKYGADAEGKIRLMLEICRREDMLQIAVRDCGPGMEEKSLRELQALLQKPGNASMHMGLYNIHRRLQLLYGQDCGVTIHCPPEGGTVVCMTLPAKSEIGEMKGSDHGCCE